MLRCVVLAAVVITRDQLEKRYPLISLSYFSSGLSDRGTFIGTNWPYWLQIYRMVQFPRRVCKPNARGCPFACFLKSKSPPSENVDEKKPLAAFGWKRFFFPNPSHLAIGFRNTHVRFMGGRRIVVMRWGKYSMRQLYCQATFSTQRTRATGRSDSIR